MTCLAPCAGQALLLPLLSVCFAGLCSLYAVPLAAAPSFKGHQFSAKYVPFSSVQSRQASQEEYNLDEVVYRQVQEDAAAEQLHLSGDV